MFFYAQEYPKNYVLPSSMDYARLYKQSGNSVVIPVINRITENIYNGSVGIESYNIQYK